MNTQTERAQEFTELFRNCHRQVFGYIFSLLRNLENAQDVFQQTSLVLWNRFDEFEPGTNFAAWACAVAQFKVRDFLKTQRRYESHLSETFALRLASLQAEIVPARFDARREALASCLEKLPARQRAVLDQCYGGTEKVADVAEHLGRPVRSLYNSLQRIREGLLDCVERTLTREVAP